ncbi:phosphoenolpyruvate synthase [Ruminiclostridium herbifermentans]|uniref:Phosphoenolpyruvate synthase n=1 Tax=Ruminiclostridium herbifermentans TaxID=2488810 RepID=A0A4U7J8T7_9FIRM|nr:phosphoenolpyruvate synthase [Ruminiclostridium herbifermentans]QNU66756.1 phosphoenolpyruvate synthase [Ruminiclostridium herbifermentans]
MKEKILFFTDINKNMVELVGGKGANLGEMTQAGFPVPPGFCITTEVYNDFISDIDLNGLDAEQAQEKLISAPLPDYFSELLNSALTKFEPDTLFSVRSSATAEDLLFASFAGQQDTYLNVPANDIEQAVCKCFASLYTERAIEYRKKNNIEKASMCVIVQQMVFSDASGILFTADPISGKRHVEIIEAGFGLGEAMVSGKVTPDRYSYNKKKGTLIERTISYKKIAVLPLKNGGTVTANINSAKQVLQFPQIKELFDLGEKLEQHFGMPQDVEWAIQDNKIYILQTRPITSLYPLPNFEDEDFHILICIGYVQMNTAAFSRMGGETFSFIFRRKDVHITEYNSELISLIGGRLFSDFSSLFNRRFYRNLALKILPEVEPLTAAALSEVFSKHAKFHKKKIHFPKGLKTLPIKVIYRFLKGNTLNTVEYAYKLIGEICDKRSLEILTAPAGQQRIKAVYDNMKLIDIVVNKFAPLIGTSMLALKMMKRLEKNIFGEELYTPYVESGLEGNITTEMGLMLGDIADLANQHEGVISELKNPNYATLNQRIYARNDDFSEKWAEFIDIYGCRCAGELDISCPRWRENPELIAKQIVTLALGKTLGDHRDEYKATVKKAKAKANEFINQVQLKAGKRKARKLAKYVRIYREVFPIREHMKYILVRIMDSARVALLKEGADMVRKGQILRAEDIFLFHYKEIYEAIEKGYDLRDLADERREELRYWNKLNPPRILTSEGECIMGKHTLKNVPTGALVGSGVSAGTKEGKAKVVLDPKNSVVEAGEILVAPFTDPGWTPLFINAAGLVTEIGGKLTHGSVVAREYGIPAVTGVVDATKKIKTGQRIRIDGTNGYVQILE